jgi:hypothetical protein
VTLLHKPSKHWARRAIVAVTLAAGTLTLAVPAWAADKWHW